MSQSWALTAWEPRWYKVLQTTTVTRLDKLTTFSKVIVCWLKLQISHSVLEAGETMLTSECIANKPTHYRQLTLDGANRENVDRKKMSKCSLPSVSETRSLLPTQLPSKQTIKCLCRVPGSSQIALYTQCHVVQPLSVSSSSARVLMCLPQYIHYWQRWKYMNRTVSCFRGEFSVVLLTYRLFQHAVTVTRY